VLRGILDGLIGAVEPGEHDSVARVLGRGFRKAQVLLVVASAFEHVETGDGQRVVEKLIEELAVRDLTLQNRHQRRVGPALVDGPVGRAEGISYSVVP
jgi:hypothetical protein